MRTVIVRRGIGHRELAALGPDRSRAVDPDRHDRRVRPQREHGEAVLRLLSAPSGLRVPSGKMISTSPASRMRVASRKASTSAVDRSTGWMPPREAMEPNTGQSNSSFLPSQWIRRVRRRGVIHDAGDEGVGVRDVVDREDDRARARDVLEAFDDDVGEQPGADAAGQRDHAHPDRQVVVEPHGPLEVRGSRLGRGLGLAAAGGVAALAGVTSPGACSRAGGRRSVGWHAALRRGAFRGAGGWAGTIASRRSGWRPRRCPPFARTCCRRSR